MASAGKTKLLTRYKYGNYIDEGSQTMIIDCTFVYKNRARYNYYDTAGQEKYRSVLNLYFKGSDAAILVYSVDSLQSFD
jgi:GTPase SAR1 family protein